MLAKSHYSGKSSVIQTAQAHKKNPIAETIFIQSDALSRLLLLHQAKIVRLLVGSPPDAFRSL
jgi:hypothetical protein